MPDDFYGKLKQGSLKRFFSICYFDSLIRILKFHYIFLTFCGIFRSLKLFFSGPQNVELTKFFAKTNTCPINFHNLDEIYWYKVVYT